MVRLTKIRPYLCNEIDKMNLNKRFKGCDYNLRATFNGAGTVPLLPYDCKFNFRRKLNILKFLLLSTSYCNEICNSIFKNPLSLETGYLIVEFSMVFQIKSQNTKFFQTA